MLVYHLRLNGRRDLHTAFLGFQAKAANALTNGYVVANTIQMRCMLSCSFSILCQCRILEMPYESRIQYIQSKWCIHGHVVCDACTHMHNLASLLVALSMQSDKLNLLTLLHQQEDTSEKILFN